MAAVACRDLEYAIEDSQASLVLATPELAGKVQPLLASSPTTLHVLNGAGNGIGPSNPAHASIGSSSSSSSAVQLAEAALERSVPKDGALIIYTSGTTGKPKGAALGSFGLDPNQGALMHCQP